MYDIQRANVWKRISAYIFDFIVLVIVAVGIASAMSFLLNYDSLAEKRNELRLGFEEKYNVKLTVTEEEYDKMTESEKENYNKAYEAFVTNPEVNKTDVLIINLTFIIVSFSVLFSYLVSELLFPVVFKNGQTLGKKIFGIGVMREDGVKISAFQLVARTVLGKYTIETMLPILFVLLFFFNVMPLFCLIGLLVLLVLQAIFTLTTRLHTPIHDLISGCVTVDLASQMIFSSQEEMIEYKKRLHAESVQDAEYR